MTGVVLVKFHASACRVDLIAQRAHGFHRYAAVLDPEMAEYRGFHARRVNRDIKSVHGDLTALLVAGVLDRTESGQVEFPYEAVKVEFLLQAA